MTKRSITVEIVISEQWSWMVAWFLKEHSHNLAWSCAISNIFYCGQWGRYTTLYLLVNSRVPKSLIPYGDHVSPNVCPMVSMIFMKSFRIYIYRAINQHLLCNEKTKSLEKDYEWPSANWTGDPETFNQSNCYASFGKPYAT